MKKFGIGLFGFGCVGQGLYKTLAESTSEAEILKICVKDKNKVRDVADKIVFDPKEILEDDRINIVVELIDDADQAFQIVKEALTRGKAVVTANKKMVAEHMDELVMLQKEYQTPLLYEGAVCGSIPVIRNLEDYYASERIEEIRGIFNGSSNYILTKLFQEGKTYEEALLEAQQNGFAESDPVLDVGGFDTKYKLSIVLQHAFGIRCHPDHIFNWGIQNITDQDIRFAKERNLKIKLLANAHYDGRKMVAWVAPQFVDDKDPLFHVENEFNCVLLKGKYASHQTLVGKGAGSLPTGLAVLSDVVALTKGYSYQYSNQPHYTDDIELVEVYTSFEKSGDLDHSIFESISEKFVGSTYGYVIGQLKLSALSALLSSPGTANIIFTSGKQAEVELPRLSYSYANGAV